MARVIKKIDKGKLLKLDVEISGNKISTISINGDFFVHPEESIRQIEEYLEGQSISMHNILNAVRKAQEDHGIRMIGITPEAIADAVLSACPWRLILDKPAPATWNMAVDTAIMSCYKENRIPTLRFYSWRPRAVSIGYFQDLADEVNLDIAAQKGIDVVRRMTGGGAVFHDKELTYSIVLPDDPSILPDDIVMSYEKVCAALVSGLDKLGISARFMPINDIMVNDRKISGNAQTRRDGAVLQHGTILLDVDVDEMFSLLRVPDEKSRGKVIADVKQRVTSVSRESEGRILEKELIDAFVRSFEEAFNKVFQKGALTRNERETALKLQKGRFSSQAWNRHREYKKA
jgi:lipoate-protein ligase A